MNCLFYFLSFLLVLFVPLFSNESKQEIKMFYTNDQEQVVLGGYDIISYFTDMKPAMGSSLYQIEYKGVKWNFENKMNMNKFKKNPERYTPMYGGYCLSSLAEGKLVGGDLKIWKLINGRLYFFCSESKRTSWMNQREHVIRQADVHWPQILEDQ